MTAIRLHSKLGINPRLVQVHCIACGQVKSDSIALLGSANKKAECPKCGLMMFGGCGRNDKCPKCGEPGGKHWKTTELDNWEQIHHNGICTECQAFMHQGIILISVKDGEQGTNPYRTGGWVVVKEEFLKRIVNSKELLDGILKQRMCFIPDEAWIKLGLPIGEIKPEEQEAKKDG